MRPSPVIDIDRLDLSRILCDREEIARWNPHRGLMAQLDGIIWLSNDYMEGVGVKYVRDDEFWTPGHFPERPLMPGVLQLEAAAQVGSYMFYRRRNEPCVAGFTRIREVAFRAPVQPGDTLYLLCKSTKYTPKRFVSLMQGLVGEDIVFEAEIQGMVLNEPRALGGPRAGEAAATP